MQVQLSPVPVPVQLMPTVFGPLLVTVNGSQWPNYGFLSVDEETKEVSLEELNNDSQKKIVSIGLAGGAFLFSFALRFTFAFAP